MMEYSTAAGSWDWIGADVVGAQAAIRRAATQAADRIRAARDPSRRAHRSDWTVSETAAHLVVIARANAGYARGHAEPVLELDRLDETNRARIDEIDDRDLHVLASLLEASVEDLLGIIDRLSPTEPVAWHSRTQLPLFGMLGIVLAELLLHDRDLALAQRERWEVDDADARHVVRGGMAFGPLVIDRNLARERPVSYRVRCPGVPTSIWRFADGSLRVSADADQLVDCQLRLDATTLMLVAFGRRSPLHAALHGRALSWGRRPLAAFRMPSYFRPSS